jgi:hypothetical protein
MNFTKSYTFILAVFLAFLAHAEPLRLNHIQVIGTHNSYHVRPEDWLMETVQSVTQESRSWDYSHAPLNIQLDCGVRSFELDIHPFTDGFAVMHVPVVDPGSTCPTFVECLQTVREWSKNNPHHIPVSFLLEFKIAEAALDSRPLMALDFSMLSMLEAEIQSVFPRESLLTPDDVRGEYETLTAAVKDHGWPPLKDTLGKVLFVLHNRRELRQAYTESHPTLEDRIMFVNSSPDRDDCAFIVVDNPYSTAIPELLSQGMMLRIRADGGLREGREGDTSRREVAFASGAQVISTDFPAGGAHPVTGYVVAFEDNAPARCSPVNAPADCDEQLTQLLSL